MGSNSGPSETPRDIKDLILTEAKRIEEDCLYAGRTHYEAARLWNGLNLGIGIPTTIAAAASGASAVAEVPLLAAVFALVATVGAALATFLHPSERASRFLAAGNAYNALRNDARIFAEINCVESTEPDALRGTLSSLNERRNSLNSESPNTPRNAYKRAKRRIQRGEATHAVDSLGVSRRRRE